MSKFSDALKLTKTGEYGIERLKVRQQFDYADPMGYNAETSGIRNVDRYRISAELGTSVWYPMGVTQETLESDGLVKRAKEALVYELFGEFKPYFVKVELAILEDDKKKALDLLQEVQGLMYDLG